MEKTLDDHEAVAVPSDSSSLSTIFPDSPDSPHDGRRLSRSSFRPKASNLTSRANDDEKKDRSTVPPRRGRRHVVFVDGEERLGSMRE